MQLDMVPAAPIVMLVDGFDPETAEKSRPQLLLDGPLGLFSPLFIEGKTGQSLRCYTGCARSRLCMRPSWVYLTRKEEDFAPSPVLGGFVDAEIEIEVAVGRRDSSRLKKHFGNPFDFRDVSRFFGQSERSISE